jgi:hypothetical protein
MVMETRQARTLIPTQASDSNDNHQPDYAWPHGPRHLPRNLVEFIRKPMHNSAWWTAFLSQEAKAILINDHHGKEATSFCHTFRVPK